MPSTSKKTKPPVKNHITRSGRMLGGWVPRGLVVGVREWIRQGPERDISTFLREAAREKLRREKIMFSETCDESN